MGVRSLDREDPLRSTWQPTAVFFPGESHGQRSLVGYSPGGRKELDTTERLHFHFHHSFWASPGLSGKESACSTGDAEDSSSIPESGRSPGEGNSNPRKYSCLENPVDGGAW